MPGGGRVSRGLPVARIFVLRYCMYSTVLCCPRLDILYLSCGYVRPETALRARHHRSNSTNVATTATADASTLATATSTATCPTSQSACQRANSHRNRRASQTQRPRARPRRRLTLYRLVLRVATTSCRTCQCSPRGTWQRTRRSTPRPWRGRMQRCGRPDVKRKDAPSKLWESTG